MRGINFYDRGQCTGKDAYRGIFNGTMDRSKYGGWGGAQIPDRGPRKRTLLYKKRCFFPYIKKSEIFQLLCFILDMEFLDGPNFCDVFVTLQDRKSVV